MRFAHGQVDHDLAVANSRTLFLAAKRAGIRRIVHISITNPSDRFAFSLLPWQGPRRAVAGRVGGLLCRAASGHPLWWRRCLDQQHRLVATPGSRLRRRGQPGTTASGASMWTTWPNSASRPAASTDDSVTDAVGPERPTFNELVKSIRHAVGARTHIIHVPGALVPPLSSVLGLALRDVLLTKEEYQAMAAGLADTGGPPTGSIRLSDVDRGAPRQTGRQLRQRIEPPLQLVTVGPRRRTGLALSRSNRWPPSGPLSTLRGKRHPSHAVAQDSASVGTSPTA